MEKVGTHFFLLCLFFMFGNSSVFLETFFMAFKITKYQVTAVKQFYYLILFYKKQHRVGLTILVQSRWLVGSILPSIFNIQSII